MKCDCAMVRDHLELFLLDGVEPAEGAAIQAHLDGCPDCRQRHAEIEEVRRGLRCVMAARPDDAEAIGRMCARVREALAGEVAHGVSPAWKWTRWLKVAAILVLLLSAGYLATARFHARQAGATSCAAWRQTGIVPLAEPDAVYPLILGKRIVALKQATGGVHIEAFAKCDGSPLWETAFRVLSSPVSNGKWLVAWIRTSGGEAALTALDVNTGRPLREYARRPAAVSGMPHPSILDDLVCWADNGRISAVDLASGRLRWTSGVPHRDATSRITADDRHVYVAGGSKLAALDRNSGQQVWTWSVADGPAMAGPMLVRTAGGHVLVAHRAASSGVLTCLDPATGDRLWSHPVGVPASVHAAEHRAYVRSANRVEAFDMVTGAFLWRLSRDGCGPLAVHDGLVYIPSGAGGTEMLAVDSATGKPMRRLPVPGSCSGIVIEGRRGVVSARDGTLYALSVVNRG